MKISKTLAILVAVLALCCAPAMAAQDKNKTIEGLLERLAFAQAGTGEQTIIVVCSPECPRCERFSGLVDALSPEQAAKFEFRWVMQRGSDPGLLYVMENGNVSQMYKDKQPKPIADEQRLSFGMAYNDAILSQVFRYVPIPAYTPIIIFKKDGAFCTATLEDVEEGKIHEVLDGSGHVDTKPLVSIVEDMFKTFDEVKKRATMTTIADTPIRLLPVDDSPSIDVVGPGFRITPVIEKDGWYGIEFNNPPFLFIRKGELEESK